MNTIKDFIVGKELVIAIGTIVVLLFLVSRSHNKDIRENMVGNSLEEENANLKLLAKYLTLIIRKSEAQKELYTIETGKRQVYNSPTLVQLNRQITIFKEKIRSNPSAMKYFDENLNITL